MLLLIGSEAAHRRMTGTRTDTDIDLVTTMGDMMDFVEDQGLTAAPIAKTKFVGDWCGANVMIDVAAPGSSSEELLDQVTGDIIQLMEQKLFLPDLNWLYTIKMSHRFLANDPNFLKTMRDIHDMRAAGAKVVDEAWLALRELETYTRARPAADASRTTIFDEECEAFPYKREELHDLVKHFHKPAYQYYQGNASGIWCNKVKWKTCSDEVKQAGVLEECYVMALERCLIPHPTAVSTDIACRMALEKICTSSASGYFREYAWENFQAIADKIDIVFYADFLKAINAGTLVRPKPIVHGPASI